ncbi:uncharacterized protein TNCV_3023771 [Trichonephila clavipes]|nr:uncharacterized protein TNCV_3023771 [Trichonephila clavipes]
MGKTPAELFLGRKIITPFRKLVRVTDGAEYVGGNIEKLFDEARQNMQRQHKTWEKYYNRKRRAVNIKVNDLVLVETHFISAAGRRVVGKFMPKFEGPYRGYSDTNSFDSINETLYGGKESSNWSNRSNSGKSRRSRKPSANESKSCKSNKGTTGLEDLRFKCTRPVSSTGTGERYDRKRPKICRKRSLQGSEYAANKRKVLVSPQGLKRGVPSSISSRTHKYIRKSTNKPPTQGPEILSGTSNQGKIRKFSPLKEESRRGARVQSDRARETRTTGSKEHSAAEGRRVQSRKTTTVRPCPYYLKSPFKEPEGLPEEQRSTGIDSLPQNSLRRRSGR